MRRGRERAALSTPPSSRCVLLVLLPFSPRFHPISSSPLTHAVRTGSLQASREPTFSTVSGKARCLTHTHSHTLTDAPHTRVLLDLSLTRGEHTADVDTHVRRSGPRVQPSSGEIVFLIKSLLTFLSRGCRLRCGSTCQPGVLPTQTLENSHHFQDT